MNKIGIIGGGNMGEAILSSIRKKYFVYVAEKDMTRKQHLEKKYKIKWGEIKAVVESSDVILVAVKPQDMEDALQDIARYITHAPLIISIAAGITLSFLEKNLGAKAKIIRAMPNLPAIISQATTAICAGKNATRQEVNLACEIFDNLGKTVVVEEELMDAVTAISGSGPAYLFFFMECLMKAAQSLGFKEELASTLIRNTISGSINLVLKSNENPASLRAKVTSKGGTTEAALEIFLKNNFEQIIIQAVKNAEKRAKQLSRR